MSTQPRLCREIVLEHFGPIVEQVAQVLLTKGRLTLSGIVQFTQMPVRTVREALVVMIQHNICFYAEAREGLRQVCFYSIGQDEILLRLRIGRIIYWSGEWFGKEASTITHLMLLNGRLTLKDLKQWVKDNESSPQQKIVAYEQKFSQLASKRFITAVMPEDSKARIDRKLEAEAIAVNELLLGPSTREKAEIEFKVQQQLDDEDQSRQMIGMKRKVTETMDDDDEVSASKRFALTVEMEVEDDVFFRINYKQFTKYFRNEAVIDQATDIINRGAGQVLRLFLEQSDSFTGGIGKEESQPTSALHVASVLPHDMFTETGLDSREDSVHNERPTAADIVTEYFELLRQSPAKFIKRADNKGHNFFVVDFKSIRLYMMRKLFDKLMKSRFGNSTCRIARILIEKGKLEEKQVQKMAMLPAKDTREKLALLCTHGICDIQEVPKSADRAPSRTIFLWFVSLDKCYQELLIDLYRSIANVRQRIRHELATRQRLLEKMERKDVSENQDLLSAGDKKAIEELNKKVERLEVSAGRLDEMVMVYRDF
ncbi:RNA polymerase III subunit RPC82 helix-turn-helix domain-containing protein [Umbelopsis sp. AD052]|nr:RNA polymerase III subunit RPC82 helix-turn-helix domain-containing protein [Umbelopsis sp. AD052]